MTKTKEKQPEASSKQPEATGLTRQPDASSKQPDASGLTRRDILLGCAGAVVLLGIGGAGRYAFANTRLLRPPGGQDEEHFLATCIKCDRCRSACPRSVIMMANIEDGLINARTPRMDFHLRRFVSSVREEDLVSEHSEETGQSSTEESELFEHGISRIQAASGSSFCDFCNLCIENCPTGALMPFDPQTQWIGLAVIVPAICIAFEKRGGCRKCVDYCPFNAITLDENKRPIIDPRRCNGCGICENICPANSYRTYKGTASRGVYIEVTEEERPR